MEPAMPPTPDRIVVDDGKDQQDKAMAYVLTHIDTRFDDLRKHIDQQMASALEQHTERMSTDSDMARPYWHTGADHIGERAKDGLVRWIGGKVLTALLTALAVGLAAFGVSYWGRK